MISSLADTSLSEGWRWGEKDWETSMKRVHADSTVTLIEDPEGWEYARNWPESRWRDGHAYGNEVKPSMTDLRSKVRRRLWVRSKVATNTAGGLQGDGSLAEQSYSSGLDSSLLGEDVPELTRYQAHTLHSLASVADLSRAVNLRLLEDRAPMTNSAEMLQFMDKVGEASERVMKISLWKPLGGGLGDVQGSSTAKGQDPSMPDRDEMAEDVLDAITSMIRDINSTQRRIQEECDDQVVLLEALKHDVDRSHARLHQLTKRIEEQLRK